MTIAGYDHLDEDQKKTLLFQCCGSQVWVSKMIHLAASEDLVDLLEEADAQWQSCTEKDWKEAFTQHPRIGDVESLKKKFASDPFAGEEQRSVEQADIVTLQKLAMANEFYEERFGYIFIVCATGKSAADMLEMITKRLRNDPRDEIKIAMEEQGKITRLRLEKLFDV